jgi:hypothetical protein
MDVQCAGHAKRLLVGGYLAMTSDGYVLAHESRQYRVPRLTDPVSAAS